MSKQNLKTKVEEFVAQIPEGRVMTYGQLAALAGSPRAARVVGGIAHYGDPDLPWHRVVNKKGGLASGYHGGRLTQKEHLEAEGVIAKGEEGQWFVAVSELLWWPKQTESADYGRLLDDREKPQI
jgi:methylated-DNA-protein-cysteine methyltransferase-like protein